MTVVSCSWLLAGMLLGGAHAAILWHASQRTSIFSAVMGMLRVMAIGALFFGAATAGGLLPTSLGWGVSFPIVVAILRVLP